MISTITPTLNSIDYLKKCILSVADQLPAQFEHIIIDGKSNDETIDFLSSVKYVKFVSRVDKSMYDAINTGLNMVSGDIIGFLNSDEQYLLGTLDFVEKFFAENENIDLLFGDALLVDPNGLLLAFRKAYRASRLYIMCSHLYFLTCTMFVRRKIIDAGFRFNSEMKSIADRDFVVSILKASYAAKHVNRYFSTFTITGNNLSNSIASKVDINNFPKHPIYKFIKYPVNLVRLVEKFFSGAYFQHLPISYEIYTSNNLERKKFISYNASYRWIK